jgi:hypothetical protein
MNEYVNIIKSDIVLPQYDELWDDVSPLLNGATPKPVLVLVNKFAENSQEAAQLQKMLDGCLLTAAQYNVVPLDEGQYAAWHQLRTALHPKIIFMIGILPAQLGISAMFQINMPNRFSDCIWLPTLSITELERQPNVKSQLWNNGMKPVLKDKSYGDF